MRRLGTNQYSTAMSRECSWKAEGFLTRADGLLKKIIKKRTKNHSLVLPSIGTSSDLTSDEVFWASDGRLGPQSSILVDWQQVLARSKEGNRPRRVLFRKRRREEVAFFPSRRSSFGFQSVSAVVARFAASGIHLTSNCLESPLPHPD